MRRQFTLACLIAAAQLAVGVAPVSAQETIPLSKPITFAAPATITGYELADFHFQRVPAARLTLVVVAIGSPTQTVAVTYPDDCKSPDGILPPVCAAKDTPAEVAALMQQLNTGNHTSTSLWRKVLNAACTDFPAKFPNCTTP